MFYIDLERERGADWIDASKAIAMVMEAHQYTARNAGNFLIRRAGTDRIRTWCPYMKWLNRAGSREDSGEQEDCLIAPDFWVLFDNAACRKLEDWKSGDFSTRRSDVRGATKTIDITSAKFSKTDLMKELPAPAIEWVSARDALHQLTSCGLRHENAAIAICKRAYAGVLQSRAAHYTVEVEDPRVGKKQERATDALLPPHFWWAEAGEALEQNWLIGDFSTWLDHTFQLRAFGVEFDRAGINAIALPTGNTLPSDERHNSSIKETAKALITNKGKSRALTHDHPYAAAMAALELRDLSSDEQSRLTGASVAKSMERYYEEGGGMPHQDSLDEYGKSVLRALKNSWART